MSQQRRRSVILHDTDDDGRWIKQTRWSLMFLATLAALNAYRAGLKHPGGGDMFHRFRVFNNMTLSTSLLILLLLSSDRFYGTPARMATLVLMAVFDVVCIVCAFVFGAFPADPMAGVACILGGVGICALSYAAAHIYERFRRRA